MRSSQRRFLIAAGAGGAAVLGALAWRFWPEQGFVDPCRSVLPPDLARHELVVSAWEGLDPARLWDCHAHLVGTGDSGSGVAVNERMWSPLSPLLLAQLLFHLNAGCVHEARDRIDAA